MEYNFEGRRHVLGCRLKTAERAKADLYNAIATLAKREGIDLSEYIDEDLAGIAVCDITETDKFQRFIVMLSEYEAAKKRIEICLQILDMLNDIADLAKDGAN